MKKKLYRFCKLVKQLWLIGLLLFSSSVVAQGFKIPEKPSFQTSVYDYAKLLTTHQKQLLENKLVRYSDTTSTQIVLAIIASTHGENINYLAANWGEAWGIGDDEQDNGVLVLLARNDRKIAIQNGRGVEHLLTDFRSKQIIEQVIIPEFKRGDYYAGLDRGVEYIFKTLTGEFKGQRKQNKGDSFNPSGLVFIIFIVVLFILIARGNKNDRGGKGGRRFRRRGSIAGALLETIILSNAGRGGGGFGGFGGSSSGGGGFGGGFGGGSFSGGGASGSW